MNYSENAKTAYRNLFLVCDKDDNPIEEIEVCHIRVSSYLADHDEEFTHFKEMLDDQMFRINTPAMVNAGVKRSPILCACFIIGLEDDMDSIIKMWESAARVYEGGGGCGIPITNLREANAPIKTGGFASGPLSYLRVIQSISDQVKSGGRSRRAANLASYDCYHPDAFDITRCKNDKQSFQAINLSMLVDNDFMENADHRDMKMSHISPNSGPTGDMFYTKELWDEVVSNAWNGGDPGLLFYDRLNEDNPTPSLGDIRTTNPCGEVPEMPWTACVLGHWNLNKFLNENKNANETWIDWNKFRKYIYWGVLMLNRIIDKTAHPNKEFREMMAILRPIGMGFMGLADVLYKMSVPYGSNEAKELVQQITKFITREAFQYSHDIAKDGLCPKVSIPDEDRDVFFNFLEKHDAPITEEMCNTQVTCIAPTGSTSISADCSYGFEPQMALIWEKKLSDSNETMYFINQQFMKYCSERGLSFDDEENKHILDRIKKNKGSIRGMNDIFSEETQNIFVTAHDIGPKDRIDMQAAAQENITMSISSTVNLPNSATEEDVAEIYKYAWKKRLKGITIFRDGCLDSQPVSFGESDSTVKETPKNDKKAKRERPKVLNGETHKLKTGSGTLYLTVNELEGQPFEVFATIGNSGRTTAAKAEALGRMTSLALRSGVSVEEIVNQLEGIGGDYQIFQEGTLVKSIPDGIALILKRYLNGYEADEGSSDYTAVTTMYEGEISSLSNICPKCGQPTLRHDTSCRGGECINPDCLFSNCS